MIFFLIFSPLSFSLSGFLIAEAEEDSFLDPTDLADIEGAVTDADIEKDFGALDGEESVDNFDAADFEVVEKEDQGDLGEGDLGEGKSSNSELSLDEKKFDEADYEVIDPTRPDHEVVSDKKLEREFAGEFGDSQETDPEKERIERELSENQESSAEEGGEGPVNEAQVFNEGEAGEGSLGDSTEGEAGEGSLGDSEGELLNEGEDRTLLAEEGEIEGDSSDGALNLITNIRYVADKDRIIIDCSEPSSYQERKNKQTNQLIIEIFQAKLAGNLHWPYPFRDFSTNFGFVKADQKNSTTVRIVVQLKEGADFPKTTLTKTREKIIIAYGELIDHQIIGEEGLYESSAIPDSILPAKTLEDLYSENIKFSGHTISFHVENAPIKQVLRFISEESGLNMVIGEGVGGSITLKLEDIPWDQALHTIFKVKSLGYTREGNVITVLPLAEIERQGKKLKEISELQKSLAPYKTKVISVNYGRMGDIQTEIKKFSTPKSKHAKGGQIIENPQRNSFIVIDTPAVIKKIEALVRYLDKAPRQVMVEAKIVEVSKSFSRNFGLSWDLSSNVPLSISPSGLLEQLQNIGVSFDFKSSGSSSLDLTGLPIVGDISASLNLAESEDHARVVSSPKVVVISGKAASITRDTPIRLTDASVLTSEGDSKTTEKTESIAVSLNVTPTVTSTKGVFMNVTVNRTDPGGPSGAFKTTRNATTEVLAKNGQTIVIGGIHGQNEGERDDGIPFLKDIPFFSMLFGGWSKSRTKAELLIFITPTILDDHV